MMKSRVLGGRWLTALVALALACPAAQAAGAESASEDTIVFASKRGSTTDYDLLSIGVSTGDVRRLTDSPDATDLAPKASFDGTRIVFQRHDGGHDAPSDIWIVNSDGSGLRQLTSTPSIDEFLPTLSPDGKRLAYYNRNLNWVEVADLDGPRRIQLRHDIYSILPDWSPDGRRIAYTACDWLTEPEVWTCGLHIADSDGSGTPVARTSNVNEMQAWGTCLGTVPWPPGPQYSPCQLSYRTDLAPAWSPDGRTLAFYHWQAFDADLFAVDVDAGDARPLTADPAHDGLYHDRYPDWSPDGGRIVFTRVPNQHRNGSNPYEDAGLFVVAPDGSGASRITHPVSDYDDWQPTWTVAPKPSALPVAPPGAPPTPAFVDSAPPRIELVSRTLRLSRRGSAAIRLRCMSRASTTCRGRLELWVGRHRIGRRAYEVAPHASTSLQVRVSSAGRRIALRRGSLPIRVVLVTDDLAIVGGRAVLRAPRRGG